MNCNLEFIYYSNRPEGTWIAPHQHHCHELVYYFQGEGATRIDHESHPFRSGSFAIISPQAVHDEAHNRDGEVFFIGFVCKDTLIDLPNGVFADTPEAGTRVADLLLQMKTEMALQRPYQTEKLNLLTGMILVELARRFRSAPMSSDGPSRMMMFARHYMDEHYQQAVDLQYLASVAGYSYDRFRHLFKETTGMPPLQYLYSRRLECACRLLRQTDQSLSAIAEACGFAGSASFSSMFRRAFGLTPREYRKRHMP